MLVLLRKVGESIVIRNEIIVRVVRVSGNRAYLAIEAPRSVRVDREEIRLAKDRECSASGHCGLTRMQAGRRKMRQNKSEGKAGSDPVSVDITFVRRAIPMPKQVSGGEGREKDLGNRDRPLSSC